MTVVAGKERRSRERRTSEYRKHSLMKVETFLASLRMSEAGGRADLDRIARNFAC